MRAPPRIFRFGCGHVGCSSSIVALVSKLEARAVLAAPDSGTFRIGDQARCLHCGDPLGRAELAQGKKYCCLGCESVHALLESQGLGRYYELRGERGNAVTTWGKARDRKWLEAIETARADHPTDTYAQTLDVQGIHCSACVWLMEELFRREPGGVSIDVNPALGRLELVVRKAFSLAAFVDAIEGFGYLVGPALKDDDGEGTRDLLVRTGACIAIAMNAMIFAIAIYAGLDSGPIFRFFHGLTFALATLSVLVGGTVFFRSAWQALRHRILHLDVPIALGIALAYAGSTISLLTHRGANAYFDTLSVFIALMLVGRFLQQRVLDRNRRQLLASDGAESLLTRTLDAQGVPRLVACREVNAGTLVLVAPSDLVPVPATLESAAGSISLDWIDGESQPREVTRGAEIPAGAFNVGRVAMLVRATTDFSASPIVSLLRKPAAAATDAARATAWWRGFTSIYVATVLTLAVGAFVMWLALSHDVGRALEVTTAVLIITCPCAFGIATPLAYELAQAGLRRAGVFVRSASFLDRAVDVKRVVFDKTGTLTTGALDVVDTDALFALDPADRHALYNLAARSTHPKSVAIARALAGGEPFDGALAVEETAGAGLEMTDARGRYRLGSAAFVGQRDVSDGRVFFVLGDRLLAAIELRETLRADAADEVRALANAGYEVEILSGDAQTRVDELAARVGVRLDRAHGARSPEGKADWLAAHDRSDTLMVGDGLNDGPAAERAFASATPAVDRPFMPARTDFYFTTAGLRPVRLSLLVARALCAVTRRNLVFAIAYNVVTVSLAYAGLMTPLLCAVVMPVSSLSIVLATVASLSPRSPLWRS